MGIVVTIAMLLGLVVLRPTPWRESDQTKQDLRFITFTTLSLLLLGLWNILWYGLRHLGEFWGWAAIISGVAMILAAILVFSDRSVPFERSSSWISALRTPVVVVLAVCFLLYTVTIVQLNLGLSIIGR